MLFKDKDIQNELEKNGYVIIPFLTNEELLILNQFYQNVHQQQEPSHFIENIHMTSWCADVEYKQTISEGLMQVFGNASNRFFENYRRLNNVFIVKRSTKESTFKVHQDWNVVDETKYQSANVWVPLHDVDASTGALWILPKSHKIKRPIRGAGYLFPDYSNYTNELERAAISIKLKAGEAIVFYHSVIHGSPPNVSAKNREAACFTVIPENAPLSIYFQPTKHANLEIHEPEDDFMFKYKELRKEAHLLAPTSHPKKIETPYIYLPVTKQEMDIFVAKRKYFWEFWK